VHRLEGQPVSVDRIDDRIELGALQREVAIEEHSALAHARPFSHRRAGGATGAVWSMVRPTGSMRRLASACREATLVLALGPGENQHVEPPPLAQRCGNSTVSGSPRPTATTSAAREIRRKCAALRAPVAVDCKLAPPVGKHAHRCRAERRPTRSTRTAFQRCASAPSSPCPVAVPAHLDGRIRATHNSTRVYEKSARVGRMTSHPSKVKRARDQGITRRA
jgi:hypothetical protein